MSSILVTGISALSMHAYSYSYGVWVITLIALVRIAVDAFQIRKFLLRRVLGWFLLEEMIGIHCEKLDAFLIAWGLFFGISLLTGLSWWALARLMLSLSLMFFLQGLLVFYYFFLWIFRFKKRLKFKNTQASHPHQIGLEKSKHLISKKTNKSKKKTQESHQLVEKNFVVDATEDVLDILPPVDSIDSSHYVHATYHLPGLDLLDHSLKNKREPPQLSMNQEVESRLIEFGIRAKVMHAEDGPLITLLELKLDKGIKAARVKQLENDLARALSMHCVRVVEVIPGKPYVGLEIPNPKKQTVSFRSLVEADVFQNSKDRLTLALGKTINGSPYVGHLEKMPHLLVAGTTGSGKSVFLNSMLLSLLYRNTPAQLRMILIDPKMLELSVYQDIPHLLLPVLTDMKEAFTALKWCVGEMDLRYQKMAGLGVRNLESYNQKSPTTMPHLVIMIDEFADMMMTLGKTVEQLIARLAQKARAAGIHIILATQRPSVDVVTGLIKANIPSRIAFQLPTRIDSRTILDRSGAEKLLGHGDMFYLPPGSGMPIRLHGAWVRDDEVHRVVDFWKSQGDPQYLSLDCASSVAQTGVSSSNDEDPLYSEAVSIVLDTKKTSASYLQRRLKIGYNRASRLIEAMEMAGIVSASNASGNRTLLTEE